MTMTNDDVNRIPDQLGLGLGIIISFPKNLAKRKR